MTDALCLHCGKPYPLGVPCPGCGEPVTALTVDRSVGADGEISCDHRLLPVTFEQLSDGRYRGLAFDDVIHTCLTEKERLEVEEFARLDPGEWFSQLAADHADGVIRREDIEGDEAWNRLSGEPSLFGVEVIRDGDAEWQVSFWALEHVREEPFESRLRAEIDKRLRSVAGVTDVYEEDREVYAVTGHASGEDLARAGAAAVDQFASELRQNYGELGG